MSVATGGMKRLNPYLEVKEETEEVDIINQIPDDVLILILTHLNPTSATSYLLTCKKTQILHTEKNPLKYVVFNNFAFAPPHWNNYSEESVVSEKESIKSFQTLSSDIYKHILKNKEKCILFYIPEKLGEEEMTGTLFKEYLMKNKIFTREVDPFLKRFFKRKIKSGWILMMDKILPKIPFEILAKKHNHYSNLDYFNETQSLKFTKPATLSLIIGIYTKFLKTGVLHLKYSLTRCRARRGPRAFIGYFTRYNVSCIRRLNYFERKPGIVAYHRFKTTENKAS